METRDIVAHVTTGNLNQFQSDIESTVMSRLQTRIADYRQEVAASFSAQTNDDE